MPPAPHILVLDNEPTLTAVMADVLESDGYRVSVANDARMALELARREPPTLILSDIMMPGMDGLRFIRELRRDSTVSDTPVIFFTASREDRLARELGACDVLRKPATREELLQKVFEGVALGFVTPRRSPQGSHAD